MPGLGKEIFRIDDGQGPVVVHEQGPRRTLTFGNQVEQSGLNLDDPTRLEDAYTQAMALALLLVTAPRHCLVLGLGGGALVRALREQRPGTRILAVEYRRGVIEAARACFFLDPDPRLRLVEDDAAGFVGRCEQPMDLIFADLYGPEGMADCQVEEGFLVACRNLLQPGGLFVANLWDSEYRTNALCNRRIKAAFDGRVLFNHVQGGNIIAYGFSGELPRPDRKRFFEAAQVLGHAMRIPLQKAARSMWRQNAQALQLGRFAHGRR